MHACLGRGLSIAVACLVTSSAVAAPETVNYEYDDAGRLKTVTFANKVVQYQYDSAGNRTSVTMGVPDQVSIADASVTEGGTLTFVVTKSGTFAQGLTVECVSSDQTAESTQPGTAPFDDYTPLSPPQVLTFPPGAPSGATQNCTITTKQDAYYEGSETLNANVQNVGAGAVIGDGNAVGTITDNDPVPQFSVASVSHTESASPNQLQFTISRTNLTEYSHGISYATSDGTALVSDSDYTAVSSQTTFTPAQTTLGVNVAVGNDGKYELNETIQFTLSSPTQGAVIGGTNPATGTINNDDTAPTFSINSPAQQLEGTGITFTVTKSGSTGLSHNVDWRAQHGTTDPGDFTPAPVSAPSVNGTLTFAHNETQKTIAISTFNDGESGEGTETFSVHILNPTNGATIQTSPGSGSIADPGSTIPPAPANIWTSPAFQTTNGNFTVLWSSSAGAVNYVLEESVSDDVFTPPTGSYTQTGTSRAFTKSSGVWYYRVKACNAGSQCSAWTGPVVIEICTGAGCD